MHTFTFESKLKKKKHRKTGLQLKLSGKNKTQESQPIYLKARNMAMQSEER